MNSFGSQSTLKVGNKSYEIFRLNALEAKGLSLRRLPYSLRDPARKPAAPGRRRERDRGRHRIPGQVGRQGRAGREIAFMPARVLMQDFTGVPAIVDLAAMRDAMKKLGGDPEKINPLQPAELVIDHSVQVDEFGTANAYSINARSSFSATASAMPFSSGDRRRFATSPPCRRAWASATR